MSTFSFVENWTARIEYERDTWIEANTCIHFLVPNKIFWWDSVYARMREIFKIQSKYEEIWRRKGCQLPQLKLENSRRNVLCKVLYDPRIDERREQEDYNAPVENYRFLSEWYTWLKRPLSLSSLSALIHRFCIRTLIQTCISFWWRWGGSAEILSSPMGVMIHCIKGRAECFGGGFFL